MKIIFFPLLSVLSLGVAHAAPSCEDQYFNGQSPNILNDKYKQAFTPLCFNGFAVGYSGLSRTPLWSAESLTADRVAQAKQLTRVDNFHEEPQLPNDQRATLSDYASSGYDRGHLSPNGDMPDEKSQFDSFTLANIVPQNSQQNRGLWKDIEINTRYLATKYKQIYVVTGVSFNGEQVKQLKGRVLIPSYLYKAIYIPSINKATAYYAINDNSGNVEQISLSDLSKRIGVDVMPNLSDTVKNSTTALPLKRFDAETSNDDRPHDFTYWFTKIIEIILHKLFSR